MRHAAAAATAAADAAHGCHERFRDALFEYQNDGTLNLDIYSIISDVVSHLICKMRKIDGPLVGTQPTGSPRLPRVSRYGARPRHVNVACWTTCFLLFVVTNFTDILKSWTPRLCLRS